MHASLIADCMPPLKSVAVLHYSADDSQGQVKLTASQTNPFTTLYHVRHVIIHLNAYIARRRQIVLQVSSLPVRSLRCTSQVPGHLSLIRSSLEGRKGTLG